MGGGGGGRAMAGGRAAAAEIVVINMGLIKEFTWALQGTNPAYSRV